MSSVDFTFISREYLILVVCIVFSSFVFSLSFLKTENKRSTIALARLPFGPNNSPLWHQRSIFILAEAWGEFLFDVRGDENSSFRSCSWGQSIGALSGTCPGQTELSCSYSTSERPRLKENWILMAREMQTIDSPPAQLESWAYPHSILWPLLEVDQAVENDLSHNLIQISHYWKQCTAETYTYTDANIEVVHPLILLRLLPTLNRQQIVGDVFLSSTQLTRAIITRGVLPSTWKSVERNSPAARWSTNPGGQPCLAITTITQSSSSTTGQQWCLSEHWASIYWSALWSERPTRETMRKQRCRSLFSHWTARTSRHSCFVWRVKEKITYFSLYCNAQLHDLERSSKDARPSRRGLEKRKKPKKNIKSS